MCSVYKTPSKIKIIERTRPDIHIMHVDQRSRLSAMAAELVECLNAQTEFNFSECFMGKGSLSFVIPFTFLGAFFYSFLLQYTLRSRSEDNYVMAVPLEKCHNSFMLPFLSFSMFLSRFTSFLFILVFLFHFSIDALYVSVIFLGKLHQ